MASPTNFIPPRPGSLPTPDKEVFHRETAKVYQQKVSIPLILVGGVRSYEVAVQLVRDGMTDCISLSRPLICEPGLVKRWREGDRRKSECVSDNPMARTAMIHARTDAGLKAETEMILKGLGLSYTEAINLFLNQVRMRKGLPFPEEIPDSVSVSLIERGRRRFVLKKSLRVRVGIEGGVWVLEHAPLGILAYGSTQEEALAAFRTDFALVARQVGLSRQELYRFVDCPTDGEKLKRLLVKRGKVRP